MARYYILDGNGEPVPVESFSEAEGSFEKDRRVALDDIAGSLVSTVFLVIDHQYDDDGPPLLFETLVFGGPLADEMDRYSTRAEALAGHAAMVARVRAKMEGAP